LEEGEYERGFAPGAAGLAALYDREPTWEQIPVAIEI